MRVLYFGVLKERFGAAEETIELAGGATVGELVRVLRERPSNPAMAKRRLHSVCGRAWRWR